MRRAGFLLLGSALAQCAPPARADEAAAETTPADAAMASHAVPVADYTLHASLDPAAHTVHGEGTITWRNASKGEVTELWVHLYLNAFKNTESAFLSEPVGRGARGTHGLGDWGYIDVRKLVLRDGNGVPGAGIDLWPKAEVKHAGSEDETDVRVPLPRPVAAGETIHLDMVWDDKLPTVLERTGYEGSFHMVAQWFPKLARLEPDGTWAHFPFHHLSEFYADFGTYDVTVDVPRSYVVGATGLAVESRVAGERLIERHVQGDVHDFAWTAWDKFQTRREIIDGVQVTALFPPGYDGMAERELAALRFTIPHFGRRYGRYPYPTLTVVHPPAGANEAGGMEYPTLITTGGSWWIPRGVLVPELVTVHEFGHQYFYGLLASNEERWPFLDEGLNSFAEQEALAAWRGSASYVDMFGLAVADSSVQASLSRGQVHDEPIAQPAVGFDTGTHYGALVYFRTATILETLRRVHGGAAFDRALGTYARRHRFQHPGPEDLLACVRETLGERAATNLRRALFDKAWVDYSILETSSRRSRGSSGFFDREGNRSKHDGRAPDADAPFRGSVLVARRGELSFPVDVELAFEDGTRQTLHWDGVVDRTRLGFESRARLVGAVVDPTHAVLVDQHPANNHAHVNESDVTVGRTTERATYWTELVLQAIVP